MSSAKRQKQKDRNPLAKIYNLNNGFAMVPMEIINSAAYRDLLPSAAKYLPVFIFKYSKNTESGSIIFTYAEAQRLGISRKGFYCAIKNLVAKGFIDIVAQGGLHGVGGKSSQYTLSRRFRDYQPKAVKPSSNIDGIPWEENKAPDGGGCLEAA